MFWTGFVLGICQNFWARPVLQVFILLRTLKRVSGLKWVLCILCISSSTFHTRNFLSRTRKHSNENISRSIQSTFFVDIFSRALRNNSSIINTIASILRENMYGYLSVENICSKMRTSKHGCMFQDALQAAASRRSQFFSSLALRKLWASRNWYFS